MALGGKILSVTSVAALTACTAETAKLEIRPVGNALASVARAGSPTIQEARNMFALGNTGLALEGFRKALREEPRNTEALAGVAACYERMGRFDLARANYEAALAITPGDPVLLNTFAASLERSGRRADAVALRAELARLDEATTRAAVRDLVPEAIAVAQVDQATAPKPAVAVAAPSVPAPPMLAMGRSTVTVALPPVRPVPAARVQPKPAPLRIAEAKAFSPAARITETLPVPPSGPVKEAVPVPTPIPATLVRMQSGEKPRTGGSGVAMSSLNPRLERLSLGEVALVTRSAPLWRPQVVAQTRQSVTVRWVALKPDRQVAVIRLLNAARHEGLAARTRLALATKGWKQVTIGDAGRVRERSLVLYSPATLPLARRLAAQFGYGIARDPRPGPLTILLGRDAVRRTAKHG